jgi:hypothetical protein
LDPTFVTNGFQCSLVFLVLFCDFGGCNLYVGLPFPWGTNPPWISLFPRVGHLSSGLPFP